MGGGFAHGVRVHQFPKAESIVSFLSGVVRDETRVPEPGPDPTWRVRDLCVLGEFRLSPSDFFSDGPVWELVERAGDHKVDPLFLEYCLGYDRVRAFEQPEKKIGPSAGFEDQLPSLSTDFSPIPTARVEIAVKELDVLDVQLCELWRRTAFDFAPEGQSRLPTGDVRHLQFSTAPLPQDTMPHTKTRWAVAESLIERGLLTREDLIFGGRIGFLDLLIPADQVPASTLDEILEAQAPKYAWEIKERTAGHAEREWARNLETWGPVLKTPRKKARSKRRPTRRRLRLSWDLGEGRWPDAQELALRDAAVEALDAAALAEVTDLGAGEGVMELVVELRPRKTERAVRALLQKHLPDDAQPDIEKL